jgi:type I restriction enzyme R subunit
VSKLLTGFDAPLNTVLYIDKALTGHNLLQAIARVNRVEEDKEYGYIVDYAGVLGELDAAMRTYSALAEFEAGDLDVGHAIIDVQAQIAKLPQAHVLPSIDRRLVSLSRARRPAEKSSRAERCAR